MTLTSPDIAPGAKIADEQVFSGFGCTGGNISPALSWSGAPKDTKSFALSVYDPDAPTGSGFWHWVVFNIPPDVTSLPKNAGNLKAGGAPRARCRAEPILAFPAIGGPCPPQGDRRITIISRFSPWTRRKLDGDENNSAAFVGFQLHFHTLAKAELIGVWGQLSHRLARREGARATRSSAIAAKESRARFGLKHARLFAREAAPIKGRAPSSERRQDPRNTRSPSIRRAFRSSPIDLWQGRICPG